MWWLSFYRINKGFITDFLGFWSQEGSLLWRLLYTVKSVILEELGDLIIERLAGRGGEVGWQADLFLAKTKLYFQK